MPGEVQNETNGRVERRREETIQRGKEEEPQAGHGHRRRAGKKKKKKKLKEGNQQVTHLSSKRHDEFHGPGTQKKKREPTKEKVETGRKLISLSPKSLQSDDEKNDLFNEEPCQRTT